MKGLKMQSNGNEKLNRQGKKFRLSDTVILLIAFVVIFIYFAIADKDFIAYDNISSMLRNMVLAGILALGLTPLMIARGLDISFGSNLSLTTVVIALLYTGGINLWISILIGILLATLIGFLNGILIESFDLLPIIFTLGMMAILQALALVFSAGDTILMLTDELYFFATRTFLKIPLPVIILIFLIVVYWFILEFTKTGRSIYLIGANPILAKLSGLKVKKVKIILYTFMGLSVGIAAVIIISLTGVGMPYHGAKLPLPTLSAVLLGGISLMGGSGSVWGTVIGVLIVTVIFNGLSVLNIPSYFIQVFQGLALVIIVAAYEIRNKRSAIN
jgi:ribose transport system permease protein